MTTLELVFVFGVGALCGGLGAALGWWVSRSADRSQIASFCQQAYAAQQQMRDLIDLGRKELLPVIEELKAKP